MSTSVTEGDFEAAPALGPRTWMVVPCYNEERRLDVAAFDGYLAAAGDVGFIFVNDGSTDGTHRILAEIAQRHPTRAQVIDQPLNQGKGEAVRVGLLTAFDRGAQYAGYLDADLATPLDAIEEFVDTLDAHRDVEVVLGARVALLGRHIARKASRHYSGRVFATVASVMLDLPVYDTQCGAKLLRCTAGLRGLLVKPFGSRWIFDVELLARYLSGPGRREGLYELPLKQWTDIGESRVRPMDFVRAIGEMAELFHQYRIPRPASWALRALSAPFARYVGVGAIGTLVHYLVLAAAVELMHASPVAGSVVGALAGAAVNYAMNYHLTFVSAESHRRTLPRFLAVATGSAVISGLTMSVLAVRLDVHYLVAQVLATGGVLGAGFVINRDWTFARSRWRQPKPHTLIRLWTLIRLPLLLAVAFAFQAPLLTLIEANLDLGAFTQMVIDVASTPQERVLVGVGLLGAIWLAVRAGRWAGWSMLSVMVAGVIAVGALGMATGSGPVRLLPPVLLLVVNIAGGSLVERWFKTDEQRTRFFGWMPGTEILFLSPYLRWLGTSFRAAAVFDQRTRHWPSVVMAVLVGVVLLKGAALVPVAQTLRMSDRARIIASGDFNGLALDDEGRYLFVTGHGLERIRRYDVLDASAPVLESEAPTGFAQGLDYDGTADRVYVYNADARTVLMLDRNLRVVRRIPVPDLSPGDPWVIVDTPSSTVTIASEADVQQGTPFLVLALSDGHVVRTLGEDPGNLLRHPARPLLYMSYFRRSSGLAIYDQVQGEVVRRTPTTDRLDRMAFWREKNEVLVAAPTASRVLRFDADTLEPKGTLPSLFGGRVIALDEGRRLMLCGSLATGMVSVRSLDTGAEVARYYLGPWIRSIAVDATRGRAFVSSNGALYELSYGS